jgi:hypothetical protein
MGLGDRVATITLTAAFQTVFSGDPRVGALAAGRDALARANSGLLAAPAVTVALHNAWLTASLTAFLGVFVLAVLAASGRAALGAWRRPPESAGP